MFDSIVTVLCVIVIGVAYTQTGGEIEGELGDVLMVIRNLIVYLRLILLVKNQKQAQTTVISLLDFNEIA